MDHAGDHSPNGNLVIFSKVDFRVFGVLRLQHRTPSLNLVTLHRELPVDASDDNLFLLFGEAPINHQHIPIVDPRPGH